MERSRRALLRSGPAGAVAIAAGCLGRLRSGDSDPGSGTDGRTGTDDQGGPTPSPTTEPPDESTSISLSLSLENAATATALVGGDESITMDDRPALAAYEAIRYDDGLYDISLDRRRYDATDGCRDRPVVTREDPAEIPDHAPVYDLEDLPEERRSAIAELLQDGAVDDAADDVPAELYVRHEREHYAFRIRCETPSGGHYYEVSLEAAGATTADPSAVVSVEPLPMPASEAIWTAFASGSPPYRLDDVPSGVDALLEYDRATYRTARYAVDGEGSGDDLVVAFEPIEE